VRPELYQASRRQPNGILRHVTHDGVDVYSVYTRAPLSGWTLAIGVPAAEIEAEARTATLYAALALLGMMGLAIGIAVFLAKRLSMSLDQARAAAQALAGGAQPDAAPTRVAEVDMLLDGLRHTSADLARERTARQQLEDEREALLRSEQEARRQAEALPLGALARPAPTRVQEVDVLQDALYHASGNLARERAAREALQEERETLLQSEREARRLAEAQSTAKDNFLAMLGHELRNPLAAIAGALKVLDMPAANAQMTAHAREIGRRQTRHLTRIVDDLLDVRRILSGKVELKKTPIDAGALLLHCCATRQVVDAGAHAWTVAVPALWVDGDATRLEQVFDNLLHNAIKYTPAGGAITVRGRAEDGVAVFDVSDNGIGIASATLPLIFEALVQGPVSIDRAQGGLGLGLALVRELAALHGGSVTAASGGLDQGSTFTLRLPLVAAEAAGAP
jgi:signal transduction histidine kinase